MTLPMIASALLLVGCLLMLIAAIGVIRMPDLLSRVHAVGVANTLGALAVMGAVVVAIADLAVAARALLVVAFMFVTMPVGSHMLGRAAHRKGEMTRVAEGGDALEWDVEKDQPDRVLP